MKLTRNYNYSSLSAAYQCQQLYHYLYVQGLKADIPQNGDLAFGSAIHFSIEQYYTQENVDIVETFNTYWDLERRKNLQYGRFNHTDLQAMGEVFLTRFLRLHAKKIKAVKVEETITVSPFTGTPDMIAEYGGVLSVIDFKTSGMRYNKLKAFLSEQMHLYAYMADQIGHVVKQLVYIIFIKGKEPSIQTIVEPLNYNHQDRLINNLTVQIMQLEKRVLDQTPFTRNTANCIKGEIVCPFFKKCWEEKE